MIKKKTKKMEVLDFTERENLSFFQVLYTFYSLKIGINHYFVHVFVVISLSFCILYIINKKANESIEDFWWGGILTLLL